MSRAELVSTIATVIHQHRLDGFTSRELADAVLVKAEPLIRADERATIKYEMGVLQWEGLRLRQERADLRAQVEALPGAPASGSEWIARDDVLALIDGSSE